MISTPLDVHFTWLSNGEGLPVPRMQSAGAAGLDLTAALGANEKCHIQPGERAIVPCGFAMALPVGFEAQVRPRSGLAAKFGITVLNAPGTIDSDYRGEIKVILINHGQDRFEISRGDRIAQMVIAAVTPVHFLIVETLGETARGTDGFGSTGHAAAQ